MHQELRKKEKVEKGVAEVVVLVTEKVKLVEREKEGVVEEEGVGGSDHEWGVSLALGFDDDAGLPSRLLHNSNSRFWFAYGSKLTATMEAKETNSRCSSDNDVWWHDEGMLDLNRKRRDFAEVLRQRQWLPWGSLFPHCRTIPVTMRRGNGGVVAISVVSNDADGNPRWRWQWWKSSRKNGALQEVVIATLTASVGASSSFSHDETQSPVTALHPEALFIYLNADHYNLKCPSRALPYIVNHLQFSFAIVVMTTPGSLLLAPQHPCPSAENNTRARRRVTTNKFLSTFFAIELSQPSLHTPNLSVGAPFQTWRSPAGRSGYQPDGPEEEEADGRAESDVIKEHGGTTKHQKDDNKQRRAFGLNITTPYQHQEISLKPYNLNRPITKSGYILTDQFQSTDRSQLYLQYYIPCRLLKPYNLNRPIVKAITKAITKAVASQTDRLSKQLYMWASPTIMTREILILRCCTNNAPYALPYLVWIQKQDRTTRPTGRQARHFADTTSHRATSPPLCGHNVPPGDKPATLRTQRPTGRQARHFTDTTSHRATSPPLCGHNVPPGDKPGIFRTQRPTGRQARYSQDTQSDRHNNAAKIHRAPTKLSPSVRQEANPSLSLGLGGDDVRWCILKVKRVIGLEAQHQNKRIPRYLPPPVKTWRSPAGRSGYQPDGPEEEEADGRAESDVIKAEHLDLARTLRRRCLILCEDSKEVQLALIVIQMAGSYQTFAEGASISRPPLFTGENYAFWKSIDCEIWDVIASVSPIPTNNLQEPKPCVQWTAEEKKRFQNDVKARNIISSALTVDEFYRISICKSAQEMWEVLRVTHEGTDDKRFTNIVNLIIGLGKSFENDELNIKFLKSLDRSWQPKVTAISESQNLNTMTMAALFGKLREHELDLGRLDEEEAMAKTKKKSLALKSEVERSKNKIEDEDSEDEENLRLMIKRLNRFMKSKDKGRLKFEKKENQGSSSHYKCYGCGERGHLKADCPNQKKNEEIKEKKSFKKNKAYIAWDDGNETISELSESDAEANICLVADDDAGSQVKPLESVELDAGNDEDLQKTTKKRKIMTIPKTKISTNYHHGDISKGVTLEEI
ncbi:hypothetical protein V8G54_002604 [Vigna mungo]|uniref:CCHC-type domain-containing protein n=1 Tax=Vigna mungo TaxID=3915 RepID=A0AAQ3P942_VIGMU